MTGPLTLSSAGDAGLQLSTTLGGTGNLEPVLQVLGLIANQGMSLILVPDAGISGTTIASQLICYNRAGTNYERFSFSATGTNGYVIDSTYNGTGTSRPVALQMGGSVGNSIIGQDSWYAYADASLDLIGSTNFTAGGGSGWGKTATRIADYANTGTSTLNIVTRTTTPAGTTTADISQIEFDRGNVRGWQIGLNASAANNDSFDICVAAGLVVAQYSKLGNLKLQGAAAANNGACVDFADTTASGHVIRVGAFNGVGTFAMRDLTQAGTPVFFQFSTAAGGPGFSLNAASNLTGDILDLQVAGTTKLSVLASGQVKTISGNEATGAGSAALGANSPAVTNTAPYTWLKFTSSDGSQVYVPAWK